MPAFCCTAHMARSFGPQVIRGSYPAIPAEYSKELAHMVKTLLNTDQVRLSIALQAIEWPTLRFPCLTRKRTNRNWLGGVKNAVHCLCEVVSFRGNCLGLEEIKQMTSGRPAVGVLSSVLDTQSLLFTPQSLDSTFVNRRNFCHSFPPCRPWVAAGHAA